MKLKVVVADDHPAVVAGVRHVLAGAPAIEVVGTGSNSTDVIELLNRTPCDVLVTDYVMPGGLYGDGLPFLSFVRRHFPALRVIVFTMIHTRLVEQSLAKLGVTAIISKSDHIDKLVSAIYDLPGGQGDEPDASADEPDLPFLSDPGKPPLSSRETEVIRLYVEGHSVSAIAARLHRTQQSVSAQKIAAMRKLGAACDADLYFLAYRFGLLACGTTSMA